MSYTVERLVGEPIVVVTIRDPITYDNPMGVTRAVMHRMCDVDGEVYRITDFRDASLNTAIVHHHLKYDINFTGMRVRSVIVGYGELIDYLVHYVNNSYLRPHNVVAFEDVADALQHIRTQLYSGAAV